MSFDAEAALEATLSKLQATASRVQDGIPYRTVSGRFDDCGARDIAWWTNGFWPGLLWLAYRETSDPDLANWAKKAELKLDAAFEDFLALHHDVGFMWKLSSVARFKLEGSEDARRRGLHAACILAGRFNPRGYIVAWNDHREGWAIIDCLMNLPLLYWASEATGDPRFREIAEIHTETAGRYFLRPDGSAKHIVRFDPGSGAYLDNLGGQGFDADSAWSRGCAWALYGFALGAHFTGRADFLALARLCAEYFLANLPQDSVPPADFRAGKGQPVPRDSSAGACAASGLLQLASLVSPEKRGVFEEGAKRILEGLTLHCAAGPEDEALLLHGCVAYHETDPALRDTSLIYGDYLYLEALTKLRGRPGLFEL